MNETWHDITKCKQYTCLEVINPCFPLNISTQIEVSIPACQACPAGYIAKQNNSACCPDCVPTEHIPEVCKVTNHGLQQLEYVSLQHGKCVSVGKYKVTGCSGLCGSTSKITLGMEIFNPKCKCCQPTEVKRYNVSMTCNDHSPLKTTFYEILHCSCKPSECTSGFNMDSVIVKGESHTKRSFFDDVDALKDHMDDSTLKRKRRSLLSDLALMHSEKRKKR